MMFSQMLASVLALTASTQIRDGVSTAQDAFTSCLNQFADRSVQSRKAEAAFTTELATQCMDQERAYRAAMIRRDVASRISQAEAESSANEEVIYARQQAHDSFTDARPARSPS